MNGHVAARTRSGEPGVASRALLILLGLLGFVLSPAIATPTGIAGLGPRAAQQTVSLKKTMAQVAPRASRGGRGSARAAHTASHAESAPAAHATNAQRPAATAAVLAHGPALPAPAKAGGAAPGRPSPARGVPAGTPRGRAPPVSTGF